MPKMLPSYVNHVSCFSPGYTRLSPHSIRNIFSDNLSFAQNESTNQLSGPTVSKATPESGLLSLAAISLIRYKNDFPDFSCASPRPFVVTTAALSMTNQQLQHSIDLTAPLVGLKFLQKLIPFSRRSQRAASWIFRRGNPILHKNPSATHRCLRSTKTYRPIFQY